MTAPTATIFTVFLRKEYLGERCVRIGLQLSVSDSLIRQTLIRHIQRYFVFALSERVSEYTVSEHALSEHAVLEYAVP